MIGILGGTFDPVHFAHLRCALEVQQNCGLDEIRFIPCRQPPHRDTPRASPAQRLAMLRIAIADQPLFRIDERELHRDGPSYMVDTLLSLRDELGSRPICLLLGMDAFVDLHTWHRWKALVDLAHILVMRRPGGVAGVAPPLQALLDDRLVTDPLALRHSPAGRIVLLTVTQIGISATRIRELVAGGGSARYLLPDKVLDFIQREQLYPNTRYQAAGSGA